MNQAAEANEAWVLTLPAASAVTVAALRLFPGLEIGVAEDLLWLRGDRADDDLRGRLLGLPATARYRQAPDRRLRPEGSRLATRKTPPLSWRPLREWARVQPPPAGLLRRRSPAHELLDEAGEGHAFEHGADALRDRKLDLEAA